MSRPIKDGVDYWPFDVHMLEDKKFKMIRAEFGIKGAYVALEVINAIYADNGYYKRWDNDDCLLMSQGVGDGCTPQFVGEVIRGCIRRSLFDQRVFDMFGVLTSAGIQRRFLRIVGNSRQDIPVFKEYWLLDTSNKKDVPPATLNKITFFSVSSKENPVISTENPVKSTGNAERKEKKSKEKEITPKPPFSSAFDEKMQQAFDSLIRPCTRLDIDVMEGVCEQYRREDVLKAMEKAAQLGGRSAKYVRTILEGSKRENGKRAQAAGSYFADPSYYERNKESW